MVISRLSRSASLVCLVVAALVLGLLTDLAPAEAHSSGAAAASVPHRVATMPTMPTSAHRKSALASPHAAAATTDPLPTPPGGGAPGLPISGGWQDGEALLRPLDLLATPTPNLDRRSLYRLLRNSAAVWEMTGPGTAVRIGGTQNVQYAIPLRDATSGATRTGNLYWQPTANNGAGSVMISTRGGSVQFSVVTSAAFVLDGWITKIEVASTDGQMLLLPSRLALPVVAGTPASPSTTAELLGEYLGYQNTPPDLSLMSTTAPVDMKTLNQVTTSTVVTSTPASPTSTCLDPCYRIAHGTEARGYLSITNDVLLVTNTVGATVQVRAVALAYPIYDQQLTAASPPMAALLTFVVGTTVYSISTKDAAGFKVLAAIYSPVRDAANVDPALPPLPPSASPYLQEPNLVSTVERDYLVSRGAEAELFTVRDWYTPAQLAEWPITLLPVDAADPLTRLDDGATNYRVTSSTGDLWPAQFTSDGSADLAETVTAVAQGFALQRRAAPEVWMPVLLIQSGVGPGSIKLVDLHNTAFAPMFARVMSGRLTRTRPLASTAPLNTEGQLSFTDDNSPATVVNPASVLSVDPSGKLIVTGPAVAVSTYDVPLTLPSGLRAIGTASGFGRLEQSDGRSSTKVFAVQAGGLVYLISVAGGLTPPMVSALTANFSTLTADAKTRSEEQQRAVGDLAITYNFAVGRGLDQSRTNLATALQAKALLQSGHQFSFQTGANTFTPTLANQFLDGDAVDRTITDAEQNPGVLADQGQAWAMAETIRERHDNRIVASTAGQVTGGVWAELTSGNIAAHPALLPPVFTTDDEQMARTAAAWILQEAHATPSPSAESLDQKPLGQDYTVLRGRLSDEFSKADGATIDAAVMNAYELLGISNRQIQAYAAGAFGTDPTRCAPAQSCLNALGRAVWARASLQPTVATFTWSTTSTDPLDLAYLGAHVSGVQSLVKPGTCCTAPTGSEMASLGRWDLQRTTMVPAPTAAWRTAQFVSRGIFNDFALWADGVNGSAGIASSLSDARSTALTLLHNLDSTLADAVTDGLLHDLSGQQFADLRVGDLTDAEVQKAVDDVWAALILVIRMLFRDTGLSISMIATLDDLKQVIFNNQPLSGASLRAFFQEKPATPLADSAAMAKFWQDAVAAAASPTNPTLVKTLNDLGFFGVLSGLFVPFAIAAHWGWTGMPTDTLSKVNFALDVLLIFATNEHYPRPYGIWWMVREGSHSLDKAALAVKRKFGTVLSAREMWRWVAVNRNYRVRATTKTLLNARAAGPLTEQAVDTITRQLGWRLDSTALTKITTAVNVVPINQAGLSNVLTGLEPDATRLDALEQRVESDPIVRNTLNSALKSGDVDAVRTAIIVMPEYSDGWEEWRNVVARQLLYDYDASSSSSPSMSRTVSAVQVTNENLTVGNLDAKSLWTINAESDAQLARAIAATTNDASDHNFARYQELNATFHRELDRQANAGLRAWVPTGRIAHIFLFNLQAAVQPALATLAIVMGALIISEHGETPLAKAAGALYIIGGAAFLTAAILDIVGTTLAMAVGFPLFVGAVFLLGIGQLLEALMKRNPADDNNALREWAQQFRTAGLLAAGAESVSALLWWHSHDDGPDLEHQTFPDACTPDGSQCRRPMFPPAPASSRYLLRQVSSGNCLSINASISIYAETATCNPLAPDRLVYVLPDVGASSAHLLLEANACVDNGGSDNAHLISYECQSGNSAQMWTLIDSGDTDGSVMIRNAGSDKCVSATAANYVTSPGAWVQGNGPCIASNASERWVLVPAPSPAYLLKQTGSGLCAAIANAASGGVATLAACAPTVDRTFRRQNRVGGSATLALVNDVCLDVWQGSTANGAPIKGDGCASDPAEVFTIHAGGAAGGVDGALTVKTSNGKCLDSAGASTAPGTQVVQGWCTGSATQTWTLVAVATPTTATLQQSTGLCAAVNWATAGQFALLAPCADRFSDRILYVTPNADGTSRLMLPRNLCLAVAGATNGSAVNGATCAVGANDAQAWAVTPNGDGTNRIAARSGLCLDTMNGSLAMFTHLVVGTCTSASSQKWRLPISGPPARNVKQKSSSLCAAVSWAARDGNVVLAPCDASADRTFYSVPTVDGLGVNLVLGNGLCLIGSINPQLIGQDCTERPAGWRYGEWIPIAQSDGTTQFRNVDTSLCLDSVNGGSGLYTGVVQSSCDASRPSQHWSLTAPP